MVNQNIYNEIAQGFEIYNVFENTIAIQFWIVDYRFWEDASDEFRDVEGTLLPLWTFNFERAKSLEITSLRWNTAYKDLFAAGFGSC